MAKLVLPDVLSVDAISVINSNFDKIADEFENKVFYRDNPVGTVNTVKNQLDMDGHNISNAGVVRVDDLFINDVNIRDITGDAPASAVAAAASAALAAQARNDAIASNTAINERIYPGQYVAFPTTKPSGAARAAGDRAVVVQGGVASEYIYENNAWTISNTSPATLAATTGATLVGTPAGNVQAVLNTKAPIASPTFTGTVGGVTKAMVGLSNVDNTSDVNKPVSTAQASAIAVKANTASPAFSGNPTAPSQAKYTADTTLATTAFVKASKQYPTINVVGPGSAQALGVASPTVILVNTKQFDPDTGFNTANGRWTPQVAGWYFVHGNSSVTPGGANCDIFLSIYKNGTEAVRGSRSVGASASIAVGPVVGGLVIFNGTTDYIDMRAYSSVGGAADANLSTLCGFLVYPS